jgi:spore maturation protein CgeB
MSKYSSAHYQQDVMDEIARQQQVFFYGPGFDFYDQNDSIDNVIAKSPFGRPDIICIGHAWLMDNPDMAIERNTHLNLPSSRIPKILFLNKEYTNLEKKIKYISDNKISLVFSHLHNIQDFVGKVNEKFVFWPFAVNHRMFYNYKLPKIYDLTFTGILRNPTFPEKQTDFRVRVQQKLFYGYGELRILKRYKFRKLKIYWQGQPTSKAIRRINKFLFKEKWLSVLEYAKLLNSSHMCLNALSPMGLVSPRYFESMASKCLVLCQESSILENLFEENKHYIALKNDLSDFDDKLSYYMNDHDAVNAILEEAYQHVRENHTWTKRIQQFTDLVNLI